MNLIQNKIIQWIEQDENKIISLLSRLVQCQTPSPPGNTQGAMRLVEEHLAAENLNFKKVDFSEEMPNLLSSVKFPRDGRHLMFNGHLDVLPAGLEPGWNDDPWSGKVADGRVWGRGTSDMKAGVVAMLFSYTYLARLSTQLKGQLSISLVSDEETGFGRGTGFMFQQIENEMMADCVLSAEPSGLGAINFSSKGYMQFSVSVGTRGAISGYPIDSPSAIHIAVSIIRELEQLENISINVPETITELIADPDWQARHDNIMGEGTAETLKTVSVNVGMIKGGTSPHVISPECSFSVSVVIPVGADPYEVYARAKEIVMRFPEAEFTFEGVDSADISDPKSEISTMLQDTVVALGFDKPDLNPAVAMSDCRYWRYRGVPAYWYGPDGSDCSGPNENVKVSELLHLVRTYSLAAAKYLSLDVIKPTIALEPQTVLKNSHAKIIPVPAIRVACSTAVVKSFDASEIDPVIGPLFDQLYSDLVSGGVEIGGTSLSIIEEDEFADEYQVLVRAAFPVASHVASGKGFEVMVLPALEYAASVLHRGPTDKTGKSWSSLRKWIGKQGYHPQESYREIYIVGAPNPENLWATELQQRVIKR